MEALVGRSKAADVFRILDAIGDGKPREALSILQELFAEGEDPMAVIGPLTAQLRKLATVGRLVVVEKLAMGRRWTPRTCRSGTRRGSRTRSNLKHLGKRGAQTPGLAGGRSNYG